MNNSYFAMMSSLYSTTMFGLNTPVKNIQMKPLTFFVIYHDKVFQENTAEFSSTELEAFTWVAVNERIPKQDPEWIPKNSLLKEYEMKIH
jgi:hypothetical protein